MSKVESIKKAMSELTPEEWDELEEWLVDRALEDDAWDKQMKADSAAGRMDKLVAEAKDNLKHGRTRGLP